MGDGKSLFCFTIKGEGVEIFIDALEQEHEGWIDVIKWRWLRKFSLDKTYPIEVNINDHPMQGCNIELTAIKASDSYWWTFSLEGFGSADAVRENLRIVATHFFAKTTIIIKYNKFMRLPRLAQFHH